MPESHPRVTLPTEADPSGDDTMPRVSTHTMPRVSTHTMPRVSSTSPNDKRYQRDGATNNALPIALRPVDGAGSDEQIDVRTLLASQKAALQTMQKITEGQLYLLRTHQSAQGRGTRTIARSDEKLQSYLKQMDALCMQQRMLCCQLHDSLQPLLEPMHDGPS